MAALQETVLEITNPQDLPDLLQTIVERATNLLNADAVGMYLCDPERQEVTRVVSYNTAGTIPEPCSNMERGRLARCPERPTAADR